MESQLLFVEIEELYSGFAEANGILRLEDNRLTLEFHVKDAILGVIKSKPKTIEIHFDIILDIIEKRTFFRKIPKKIKIRVDSLLLFKSLPGLENLCEIELKLKRNDKFRIQEFLSSANLKISEHKLARAFRG